MLFTPPRLAPVLFACSTLTLTVPAFAEGSIFTGATVGQAELKDFRLPTTSLGDSEEVGEVFVGYQFTPFFATTVGYMDLGTYDAAGPVFGGYTHELEFSGAHISTIGIVPISPRVAAFATAGLYFWNGDFRGEDEDGLRVLSDSGESVTYGAGLNVDVFAEDGINLHITWQRFDTVGDRQGLEHENDYDLFLIGATYHFKP